MIDLYRENVSEKFWQFEREPDVQLMAQAVQLALPSLGLESGAQTEIELLLNTLGEARFGDDHWQLSLPKRIYYTLKPFIPRKLIQVLRQLYSGDVTQVHTPNWPIDDRFVLFRMEVLRQFILLSGGEAIKYRPLWPEGRRFSFVLTHDIETAAGQSFVREIADLEEGLGFRSAYNFVLERYALDLSLMEELRERGFEVGCHGVKHDGKLFSSHEEFSRRAAIINQKTKEYQMRGFRAPLTHRNPVWMQSLDIEYDESFFDTDPFEPIPGGAMSIWPYFLGRFVELPYTLVQDFSLTNILGETTPRIWIEKVEFLRKYRGMALLNSHPDYLKSPVTYKVYADFLAEMKKSADYWHALPGEVAAWWKYRTGVEYQQALATAALQDDHLVI